MSMTNEIPKPTRRTRVWLLLLSLPLWLPLLACTAFEWFVDPFPNSIWLLRVLNTKYLVHVRADLTIDGEPLVMERTFRCFEQVDYDFLRNLTGTKWRTRTGQAGDTLAAVTRNGRLFAMSAPDACFSLVAKQDMQHGKYVYELYNENKRLSRNELNTPVIYEIFGAPIAERIDAYVSRNLIRQGYHGVRVDDVLVEKIDHDPLKDWSNYDWFGSENWYRHRKEHMTEGVYASSYLMNVTESDWPKLLAIIDHNTTQSPQTLQELATDFHQFSTATESGEVDYRKRLLWVPSFLNSYRNGIHASSLRQLRPVDVTGASISADMVQWLADTIIPCAPANSNRTEFRCNPLLNGVMSFYLYKSSVYPFYRAYEVDAHVMEVRNPSGFGTFLLVDGIRRLYQVGYWEAFFSGRYK